MSAPPVPTSSRVSSGRWAARPRWPVRSGLRAEPAIDAAQVAQVARQRGRIVERAVEQLDGVSAALPSRRVPARPAWARGAGVLAPARGFGWLSGCRPSSVASCRPSSFSSCWRRSQRRRAQRRRPRRPAAPSRSRPWATVGRTSARSKACSPIMASPSRSTGSLALRRGRRSGPFRPRAACRSTASSARRPGRSSSSRSRRAARAQAVKVVPAPAQREALRPPGRRRRLRHGDARRGHHLPEAHGHDRRTAWSDRSPGGPCCGISTTRPSTRRACATTVSGTGRPTGGPGAAIGHLEAAAAAFAATGHGRVPVGDISREHGGDIALHETHEVGLDVDIRPIRDARNQCTWGTNWRVASYDRAATRALIKTIRAEAARPRQADLLQRSGAHRRGADALVQRPRRPHPRPLLRAVPPARDLPLRLASRGP